MTDESGLSATTSVTVVVNQTLTSLTVTPNNVTVAPGATQQFAASALDQFGSALATQPAITWSAGAGEITPGGLFTAPQTNGPTTVTAASGAASASAALFIGVFPALNDAALAAYIESLDADGSISRNDMIQILKFVAAENGGVLSSADFSDLQTIVADAAALDMPNYVQVLASDVVNGNPANAGYQGQPLGNLAAGSTATQLTELMDKWFLGTDHPAANANTVGNTPYAYASFAGDPLFAKGGPTIQDEHQQDLGDCYLISSLGSIANASPSSIENMFIDNGDGTYTVRFYYFPVPGFADGQADYVTVDSMLPVNDGRPVYSAPGAENSLWLPLAEKAYAEWNETGKELFNGQPAGQQLRFDPERVDELRLSPGVGRRGAKLPDGLHRGAGPRVRDGQPGHGRDHRYRQHRQSGSEHRPLPQPCLCHHRLQQRQRHVPTLQLVGHRPAEELAHLEPVGRHLHRDVHRRHGRGEFLAGRAGSPARRPGRRPVFRQPQLMGRITDPSGLVPMVHKVGWLRARVRISWTIWVARPEERRAWRIRKPRPSLRSHDVPPLFRSCTSYSCAGPKTGKCENYRPPRACHVALESSVNSLARARIPGVNQASGTWSAYSW